MKHSRNMKLLFQSALKNLKAFWFCNIIITKISQPRPGGRACHADGARRRVTLKLIFPRGRHFWFNDLIIRFSGRLFSWNIHEVAWLILTFIDIGIDWVPIYHLMYSQKLLTWILWYPGLIFSWKQSKRWVGGFLKISKVQVFSFIFVKI